MADKHTFFNGSGVSQVYDTAGHSVDADDRIEGSPRNPTISRLVDAGLLTDITPDEDTAEPEQDTPDQGDGDDNNDGTED